MLLGLAACDNVPTETTSTVLPQQNNKQISYTGPAPATADVYAFQTYLWFNIVGKCGACHDEGVGQSPTFARQDDINLAYSEAIGVVDLTRPQESRLVTKVAGGHSCWEVNTDACAQLMTAYIKNWAQQESESSSRQVALTEPVLKDAGASKRFPDDSSLFASTVYPLLVAHCADCHAESSSIPQAPYFSSSDINAAYDAVKNSQKIDLDTPANSRLVVRLRSGFHNCWSNDCQNDADEMEAQIIDLANGSVTDQVDENLVISKALTLQDGVIASGGSRYDDDVVALYEFKAGSGSVVYDTSGVEPALHLQLFGQADVDYRWVGGWGVEFNGADAKAQGTTTSSKKLYDFIRATGEYSIEAWVVPANVTQEGPARIISYSAGNDERNFTLGQTLYNYNFMHRSSTTDANGEPALSTADADEVLQASEQHVVVTFDPVNGRRIYVNGVFTGDIDGAPAGNLGDWDDTFAFVLGNEVTDDRQWQGKIRLVAIHKRALSAEQITRNFEVGVGEKFFLLFSVSDIVNVPQSYIMFEVAQFDSYSYLFNRPTFISLDLDATANNIPIRAMRIGINGKEASVGQAYRNLDTSINGAQFQPSESFSAKAQLLSELGTIIALEKGADADEFFLTFEQLGDQSNVVIEPQPLQPATPPDSDPAPDIGLRDFSETYITMAEVTGVSPIHPDVQNTYETIMQQLPVSEDIQGFVSSHQVAISQLAIEYCSALVNDTALRDAFFPGFVFTDDASTAFNTPAKRDLILAPLISRIVGSGLASQPATADVRGELDSLMDKLTACGAGCAADRTETVVKASCAALLGSAAVLLQ